MKFHDCHFKFFLKDMGELRLILGFVIGRVDYSPESKYLYSIRFYLIFFSMEILFKTGMKKEKK